MPKQCILHGIVTLENIERDKRKHFPLVVWEKMISFARNCFF